MNAAVWLLAGAALLGGASACALRAAWLPRAIVAQAAGAALLAVAGAVALVDGEALGSPFTGGLEPRLGVDGLSGVFLATLGLVAAPSLLHGRVAGRTGWRDRAVACLTGLFVAGAGARAVRPRRRDVPGRLGADDAGARRDRARRPQRRGRAADRLRVRRDHAPGRRGGLGRAAGARGRRRHRRPVARRRCAAGAPRGAGRLRHQGGPDAVPRLAPAHAPDRARARLGADERGAGEGRPVRPRARRVRVVGAAGRLVRRAGARRSARSRRSAERSTPRSRAS